MSATLSTPIRPAVTERVSTFSRLFNTSWEMVARYFVCRAAVESLRELDDRALRDIGLERSQIEGAVYGFITRPEQARM